MATSRNGANVENDKLQATLAKNDDKKKRYTGSPQWCQDVSVTLLHGGLDSTRQVTSK